MEKHAINKKIMRQLSLMNNYKEPSSQVLYSLYAQMVLEVSLYYFQKTKLQDQIDVVLESGDKQAFIKLSKEYNQLLLKYKKGITISEQGFELTVNIDE